MKIFKGPTFAVDIDKTLIKRINKDDPRWNKAKKFNYYGKPVRAILMETNIELLVASVARGRNVLVWSGNGRQWVKEVLTKLGLSKLKVLVMDKPVGYLDDQKCEEWMGIRLHFPEDMSQ